ncbi:hypothetical protein SFRURICE_003043 [Spodoptera frugiperda]|nr:hypothetical protein SFRURICE_003043 [Spodoptera frugiperda]
MFPCDLFVMSRYRASVEKAKGNLLRRVVQRLESEGPWSPLYHEFKANRSVDLAFVQNIKVNNVHTTGIEETTEVLLDELIPDDVSETDSDYHQQIRSWAAIPPNSPVSDLPSINELVTVIKTLPMNKSSGEDKVSNKMIIEACKSAADAILRWSMGCPQGSVIGPYLWNLGFDDLLATPLPSGCTLTGYADDGFLLIQSNTRAGLENLAKDCLSRISRWGERRLTFAPHKTYQLLLKGNLKSWPSIKFNNVPVKRKESVCYLGLVLEKNFSFIEHIKTIIILSPALNSPREVETIVFFSSPLITSSDLFRCGIQDSHSFPWDAPDFSVLVFSYPGLQELQRYGRLWRACPIKKKNTPDTQTQNNKISLTSFSMSVENSWETSSKT